MKILLVAGYEHEFVTGYLRNDRKTIIVNKNGIVLDDAAEYLSEFPAPVDRIVVTDGGLSVSPDDNLRGLERLREAVDADITVVTRDFLFGEDLGGVSIITTRWYRAAESDFRAICGSGSKRNSGVGRSSGSFRYSGSGLGKKARSPAGKAEMADRPEKGKGPGQRKPARNAAERKATAQEAAERKAAERLGKRTGEKTRKWGAKRKAQEENSLPPVSLATSKAILFTGHRGSGVTSTSVNVAITASVRGVNTILVDLDTDYRSTNLYFGEYYRQAENDEYIASSLVRTLAQPQSYQTTAMQIESNLWMTTLSYGFTDSKLLDQHFTESKIIGLVTGLKHNFSLVAIDLPLDALAKFPGLLNCIDVVALCMENSIYSALTTLRNISLSIGEQERITYLASKSKLVVTKYNDESMYADEIITPERLSELIVSEEILEDFDTEMPVAGSIPYDSRFGKQIEDDIPVMYEDSRMQVAYDEILLRLLGPSQ